MGYAKYFEDNLEMVLERTEGMPRVSGQANMYRTSGWTGRTNRDTLSYGKKPRWTEERRYHDRTADE